MPDPTIKNDTTCVMHTERIHQLELSIVEIKGDVKHIRERIDNGLSSTISKVWEKLNSMAITRAERDAKIETMVDNNSSFIDKLKSAFIWISFVAVAGGIIGLTWKFLNTYVTNGQI